MRTLTELNLCARQCHKLLQIEYRTIIKQIVATETKLFHVGNQRSQLITRSQDSFFLSARADINLHLKVKKESLNLNHLEF
jgi:hypothetical protein